jgi:hypothetical protein
MGKRNKKIEEALEDTVMPRERLLIIWECILLL